MRTIRNSKGFTLIELMIVVVIIGILAAIAIPRFTAVSQTAKQAEAPPILRQVCSLALSDFQRDSAWPATVDDITGWEAPNATYFTFTFDGAGTANAALTPEGTASGLATDALDCDADI